MLIIVADLDKYKNLQFHFWKAC